MGQGGTQGGGSYANQNVEHVLQVLLPADGETGNIDMTRQSGEKRMGACRAQQRALLYSGVAVEDGLKLLRGGILSSFHQSLKQGLKGGKQVSSSIWVSSSR